jgi:putative intracellular protease/amidase
VIIVIAAITTPEKLPVMNKGTNTLRGKNLLQRAAEVGLIAAIAFSAVGKVCASPNPAGASTPDGTGQNGKADSLTPPAQGSIPIAFLLSEGAVMIDFSGPWEVFQDVMIPGRADHPFRLYTVAETTHPIHASGGMTIIPDYNLQNAPAPKVIVIPAQSEPTAAMLDWIRKSTKNTDVTMSVCTGAFVLAKTGLLSGKAATTYHGAFVTFATQFPDIHLSVERDSLRMAISPPLAGCRPASISPSAWSSATTAARLPRRLPTISSTRDKAGWTAIQIRFTPAPPFQQLNIPSAQCAKWTLTPRRLPSPSLKARLTISVLRKTRKPSMPHPISS